MFSGLDRGPAQADASIRCEVEAECRVQLQPAGAAYLFVETADCYWVDNSDPDGDLKLKITALGAAWDGRDDAGRLLPRGSYFVRVEDAAGARTLKVTRVE